MAKKPKDHKFDVVCSGKGMMPEGHMVGFIVVKSKSTDEDILRENAYKKLELSFPPARSLDLIYMGIDE